MELNKITIQLRLMQLYYHNCHNFVGRQSFFSDHDAFASFYGAMEDAYDSVAERIIGLFGVKALDVKTQIKEIANKLQVLPCEQAKNNKIYFDKALILEQELNKLLDVVIKNPKTTEGCRDLLAGLASDCEVRQYKIKQRMMA